MPYGQQNDIQELVNLYRQRPDLFDDNQVLELERKARDLNITFKPLRDNFSLEKVVGQLTTGFVEGMTTLPVGEKPRTTYESIAHSLGHLAGFAPSILSLPVKGAAKLIGATGARSLSKIVNRRGNKVVQFFDKASVPMMFSRGGTKLVNKGLERLGANSIDFLRRGSITRNMADHAIGLGAASAVSNVWEGFDGMYDGFIHGSVAGGAFGGVGNFIRLGNIFKNGNRAQVKQAENVLKAGVGASITGLPSTLRDDPIEMQIYEYLLGGFFGYSSRPAHEAEGGKFIQSLIYSKKGDFNFRPETHPDWNKYSKKAQDYVNKSSVETSYNYIYRNAMEDAGTPPDIMKGWLDQRAKERGIKVDELVQEEAANYYNNKFKYTSFTAPDETKIKVDSDLFKEDNDQPVDTTEAKEKILKKHQKEYKDQDVIVIELGDGDTAYFVRTGGDYYGNKLGLEYKNKPADYLDGGENYIEVTSVYNPKTAKNNNRIRTVHKPLDTEPVLRKEKGKWIAKVEFKTPINRRFAIEHGLLSKNKYIFGGIKDNGTLNLATFHPDTDIHNTKSIIRALSENDSTIIDRLEKNFNKSLETQYEWFDIKETNSNKDKVSSIKEMHRRKWISNALIDAERHGYYQRGSGDLSVISFLMKEGHTKNVIDFNKREQLYHDKSLPLNVDIVGKESLKIGVYHDPVYEKYLNSKGEKKDYDSDVDGTIVFLPERYDRIMEKLGYEEGSNMNKPVIVMRMPDGGILAVKSAGYKADGEFDKPILDYMRDPNVNLDLLIFKSAAKHTGRIKLNTFNNDLLNDGKYEHTGEFNSYDIDPRSIRMNLGVFQNPKRSISTKFVKQLFGVLNNQQAEGIAEHVFKTYYEPSIEGTPEANNLVTEFVATGKKSLLKKINIDSVDTRLVHRAFVSRKPNAQILAQEFAKQILKIQDEEFKSGEVDEFAVRDFGDVDYSDYNYRNTRLMRLTGASQGSRELLKLSRKFWENSYRRYLISRYLYPKYKYSGKAWLAPKLPHMRKTNEINVGELMLDDGFRRMPVFIEPVRDKNGKIVKDSTGKTVRKIDNVHNLGQLWDAYQKFISKGTKAQIAKRLKDKSEKLDDFENALDLAFIRVPADSMGGVRILRFKGFSGKKGLSAYTNAKDNSYIGGADKDSDSAFFYQGFDAKTKKAYKDTMKEWEENGRAIDGKDKDNDILFEAQIANRFKSIESKFSPSFRLVVAQSARKSQQGLGMGIVAKNSMLSLYDYVMDEGGTVSIPYTSKIKIDPQTGKKTGGKTGALEISLKEGGHERIRRLGREIVNRSADGADYSSMIDYDKFGELLFNEAFKAELVYGTKFRVPVSYGLVKSTAYGDGGKVLSLINPWAKNRTAGRTLTLDEFQIALEAVRPNGRFRNMAGLIADQMLKDNVHESISLRSFENYQDFLDTASELLKPKGKELTKREKAFLNKLTSFSGFFVGGKMTDRMIEFFKKHPTALEGEEKRIDPVTNEPYTVKFDWEKLRDYISNDIFKVASHRAIASKGFEIYRALENAGIENPEQVLTKLLAPLARDATELKQKFENLPTPDEVLDTSLKAYDEEINLYKASTIALVIEGNKKRGIKLDNKLLEDYFDMWLVSPFNISKNGKRSLRKGGMSAQPIQSKSVSNNAIKSITDEFEAMYSKIREGKEITKEDIIFKPPKREKSTIEKAEEIQGITTKNVKLKREQKAINEEQLKVVKEFEKNLKDLPRWTKDFEDMFINWQLDMGNTIPKVAADITVQDMRALNRFWFDMKKNPANPELRKLYYYADPRTVDKEMQAFDHKLWARYTMPVKSGDTLIQKEVKRGFSTLGIMREWFNKILYLENSNLDIQNVKIKNEFRLLESMGIKDANTINDVVAFKRKNGDEYLNYENYLAIKDKIYKVNGKDYKGSELVETTDKAYTDYFKSFGDKWIYANIDWTKPINGKKLNPYLHWDKNGKFDINNFIRRTVEDIQEGKKTSVIPLENILRFQYEYNLEKLISYKTKNGKIKWGEALVTPEVFRKKYRKKVPFEPIGKFKPEEYFPQINHNVKKLETWRLQESQRFYDEAIADGKSEKAAIKAATGRYEAITYAIEKSKSNSPFADEAMDTMIEMGNMHSKSVSEILDKQGNIGFFNKSGNILPREMDMPFYDTTTDAVYNYMESIVRSHYKNLGAVMANYRIDDMLKRKPFPEFTKKQYEKYNPDAKKGKVNFRDWNDVWADYLRFYVRDSFGHKSTFPERIFNSMSEGDPLKLKKNLYYGTSDQAIINAVEKLRVAHEKKFKMPLPFLGNVPKDKAQRAEFYQRWIHKMGSMEARYELMTLLANSGVMVGNLYGGSTLNIASTGLRNFTRAIDMKYLSKNVLNDATGKPLYFYTNPSTGRKSPVKTRKDLYAWMAEMGVIDNFLQYELQLNTNLRGKGKNVGEFMKEFTKLWNKNPEVSDETIHSLAKKYKVYDTMLKYGGWFMQKSERILRLNAFMSHALQARDAYGKYAKDLKLDDPYILEYGLRGIEATQFLYHSPNRPAFMRTALGKVLSRFKLFVFNSARVRKEMYKQAKYYGFKEGTEQFERFKDLMFIDLMTFALGSMFAYSLFDAALPPPWDFLQETSEWLFGDKGERERAFFGQYPYPIAPLNYVTPPIARIPIAFASVLNGDHERFLDYHIHTMYPFGRIYRQFDQTFDEPYGTTVGRGMQQFFRLPTDKLRTRIKKARIDEERRKRISYTLGE